LSTSNLRVVAATRVLDEAEIIEAFVRHTAAYASHHVFIDNGSSDGTLDILRSLREEGFSLSVFQSHVSSFVEADHSTWLFRQAVQEHGADWVLLLDTDEFIHDSRVPEGLLAQLAQLPRTVEGALCVKLPAFDYLPSADDPQDDLNVASRHRWRRNFLSSGKIFASAELARRGATIRPGNHAAFVAGARVPPVEIPGLMLAHYSNASRVHRLARSIIGWARVLAGGPELVAAGAASHYRDSLERLKAAPQAAIDSLGDEPTLPDHVVLDPIAYRGGRLAYTTPRNAGADALRSASVYLEQLALQHGRLISECSEAAALVRGWAAEMKPLV
jgi:hypothetical protein